MKKLKTLIILSLFVLMLSTCSSVDGSKDSTGLVEIEAAVGDIEVAISELEVDLAELLADETVMERIESMSIKLDVRTYIAMNDIYMDEDLGNILSRADALGERAFNILTIEIPAYVSANPDLYDASCGDTEQRTSECLPGELQTQL